MHQGQGWRGKDEGLQDHHQQITAGRLASRGIGASELHLLVYVDVSGPCVSSVCRL